MFNNFIEREINPYVLEETKRAIDLTKKNGTTSVVEMVGPSGRGKSTIIDYLKEQIEKENDNSLKNIFIKVDFSDTTFSNFEYSSLYYLVLINLVLSQYLKNKENISECREMVYLWNKFAVHKRLEKNKFDIEDGALRKFFGDASDNAFDYISGAIGNLLTFTPPGLAPANIAIKVVYGALVKGAKEFFTNKVSNSKEINVEQKYKNYIDEFKSSQDSGVSEFRSLLIDTITKAVQSFEDISLILAIDNTEYFSNYDVDSLTIESLINSGLPITYILSGRNIPFTFKNKKIEITNIGEISTFSENDLANYFKKINILVDGKEPTKKMLNELLSSTKGNIYWIKTKINCFNDNRLYTEEDFYDVCKASDKKVIERMLRCDNKTHSDEFKTRVLHGVLSIGSEDLYYGIAKNCSERFSYTNEELGGYLRKRNNYEEVYEDIELYLKKTIKEKIAEGDNNVIDTVNSIIEYIKTLHLDELDIHEAYGVVQAICCYDQENNILEFIKYFNNEHKYIYIRRILNEAVLKNYFSHSCLKQIRNFISNKEQEDYIKDCYRYICTESHLNKESIKDFRDLHYAYKNVIKDTPEAIELAIIWNEELVKRVLNITEKDKFNKFDLIDLCLDNVLGFIERLNNIDYSNIQVIKQEFKEFLKLKKLPEDLVVNKKEKLLAIDILDGNQEAEDIMLNHVKETFTKLQNCELVKKDPIIKQCDHLIHLLSILNKSKENQNLVLELMTFGFDNRNEVDCKEKSRIYENFFNSIYEYVYHVGLTKAINKKLIEFSKEDPSAAQYSINTLIKGYCHYRNFDQAINLIFEQKQLVAELYKRYQETNNDDDLDIFKKCDFNINYVISENSCFVIYLVIYCFYHRYDDFIKLCNAAEKALSSDYKTCFETIKTFYKVENTQKKKILDTLFEEYFSFGSCCYFINRKKDKDETLKEIDLIYCDASRVIYKNKINKIKEKINACIDYDREIQSIKRDYNDNIRTLFYKESQLANSILLAIIHLLSSKAIDDDCFKSYLKKICNDEDINKKYNYEEEYHNIIESKKNARNIKIFELLFILTLKNSIKEYCNKTEESYLYLTIFDGIRFMDSFEYKNIKDNINTEIILDATKGNEYDCHQIDIDNTIKTITRNNKYLSQSTFRNCVNKYLINNLFVKKYSFVNLVKDRGFTHYYFSHIAYNAYVTFGIMTALKKQYRINLFDIISSNYLDELKTNNYHHFNVCFAKFVRSIAISSQQLAYGEEVLKQFSQIDFESYYDKYYINLNLYRIQNCMPKNKKAAADSLSLTLSSYINYLIKDDNIDKKIKDILKEIQMFVENNVEYQEFFIEQIMQMISQIKNSNCNKINKSIIINCLENGLTKI